MTNVVLTFMEWFHSKWDTSFLRNKGRTLPEIEGYADKDTEFKLEFTVEEKIKLRPIAETLAMLDGNAFLTNTYNDKGIEKEWYEMYLPEAYLVYTNNGGDNGWAGTASFAKDKICQKQ